MHRAPGTDALALENGFCNEHGINFGDPIRRSRHH